MRWSVPGLRRKNLRNKQHGRGVRGMHRHAGAPMTYLQTIPNACLDGRAWAKANAITSDSEAWAELHRPDWMLWLVEHRGIKLDESKLRLFVCDCAEDALPLYERDYPGDARPRQAIETARRYAHSEATREELAAASDAVRDAVRDAAWDAAWAAASAKQTDRLRVYFPEPFKGDSHE